VALLERVGFLKIVWVDIKILQCVPNFRFNSLSLEGRGSG